QRYYEALKGQLPIILQMANDSIINALLSIEKRFDEYDQARPSSAPASGETPPPATPTLASRTAAHDMDDLSDLGDESSTSDDDDDEGSDSDSDAASGDD
ncbi:MAG TPA: hypothetical protein VEQ59_03615, partial [Polyangiaceae bacterium]|nr:hypothetical protein [Polyangiaceae bacterium]